MPFEFTCPHCGNRTWVADQYRGQSGPCLSCGQAVTLPDAGASLPALPGSRSFALAAAILVLLGGVGLLTLAGILFWFVPRLALDARSLACRGHLEELGLALEAYHDDHGCYPPAWLCDAQGEPQHSWRVLLLPYVGGQLTYEKYRFDQPWNSPHNRELVGDMPSIYGCPASPESSAGRTNYLAVVGPGLFFDPQAARHRGDVSDPAWSTIVLVESVEQGICWMEPRDLAREQLALRVNRFDQPALSSFHVDEVEVLLANGAAIALTSQTPPEQLSAALTIAGGETEHLPQAAATAARVPNSGP